MSWCAIVGVALLGASPASHAIEEPAFTVVRQLGEVELREYPGYTVAKVVVAGPSERAGSQAFPILAGYIFGKNKGERKFAMTAPVTQSAAVPEPAETARLAEPIKMAMTAPVTQAPASGGGFLVQFVLPKGVTAATAPEPLDARVLVSDVGPSRVAAIRYSGFWSTSNDAEHLTKLQGALTAANIAWVGEPVLSRYNGPLTPPFMRRNEVWLRVP